MPSFSLFPQSPEKDSNKNKNKNKSSSQEPNDESDMELESTNTAEIFEAARQQIAAQEAEGQPENSGLESSKTKTKENQKNDDLISLDSPNSKTKDSNSRDSLYPAIEKFSFQLDQSVAQRQEKSPQREEEMDMSMTGVKQIPSLFANPMEREEENPKKQKQQGDYGDGDYDDDNMDMTQMFGNIKEKAEKINNDSSSPMKLSANRLSFFLSRRSSIMKPNTEKSLSNPEQENSEEADMDFTTIPAISSKKMTKTHSGEGVEEEVDMDFTSIQKPGNNNMSESNQTENIEEIDMEFTTIPKNISKSLNNDVDDGEADMEFTTVPTKKSLENNNNEEDMEFTTALNSVVSNNKNKNNNDDDDNNDEESDMEFTTIPRTKPSNDTIDDNQQEQTMDFTSIPKLSVNFIRDSLKRKSISRFFTNPFGGSPKSINNNDSEQDMDFTNVLKPNTNLVKSFEEREEEQEMEFTTVVPQQKKLTDSENEDDNESVDMDFTTIPKSQKQKNTQDSNKENNGGNKENETHNEIKNQNRTPLTAIAFDREFDDEEVNMDFTNAIPSSKTIESYDNSDEQEMEFTQIPKNNQKLHNNSQSNEDDDDDDQEMEMTKPLGAIMANATSDEVEMEMEEDNEDMEMTKPLGKTIREFSNQKSVVPVQNKSKEPKPLTPNKSIPFLFGNSSSQFPNLNNNVNETPTRPRSRSSSPSRKRKHSVITNTRDIPSPHKRRKSQSTPELNHKAKSPGSVKPLSSLVLSEQPTLPPSTPSKTKQLRDKLVEISPKKNPSSVSLLNDKILASEEQPLNVGSQYLEETFPPTSFTPLKKQPKPAFGQTINSQLTEPTSNSLVVSTTTDDTSLNSYQPNNRKSIVLPERLEPVAQKETKTTKETIDDLLPNVSLTEFLQNININFIDSLLLSNLENKYATSAKVRSLFSSQQLLQQKSGKPQLADYAIALQKIPTLELYRFSTKEMRKNIKDARKIVADMENDALQNNPRLFKEYTLATPELKILMNNHFKLIKNYMRLKAKGTWYEWRHQLTQGLYEGLGKHKTTMLNDRKMLETRINQISGSSNNISNSGNVVSDLSNVQESIEKKYLEMKQKLEQLKQAKAKIQKHTSENIEAIKTRYESAKSQVSALESHVSQVLRDLSEQETKSIELTKQKARLEEDVAEGEKVLKESQRNKEKELLKLKKKFSGFELVSGIKYQQLLEENKLQIQIEGSLDLVVDLEENSICKLIPNNKNKASAEINLSPCLEFFSKYILDNVDPQRSVPQKLSQVALFWCNAKAIDIQIRRLSLFAVTRQQESENSQNHSAKDNRITIIEPKFLVTATVFNVHSIDKENEEEQDYDSDDEEYGSNKKTSQVIVSPKDLIDSRTNEEGALPSILSLITVSSR